MIKKIVGVKEPSLRETSKRVGKIDKKILRVITNLEDTLAAQKDPEGVGLAAPQIGKSLQIFLMDHGGVKRVMINPEITEVKEKGKKVKGKKKKRKKGGKSILEGCLSLPHYYSPISRANKIKVKYMNVEGKEVVEIFKGFSAQIILHEVDHLKGVIFVDHVLLQNAPLYKFDGDSYEEVELV